MALQDLTPQLRTRLGKVEWSVGLFLGLTGLLMLGGFAYFLKSTAEARGWFITEVPYYTYLPDATGIRIGTPVNMMGFKIGEVTRVEPINFDQRNTWTYYTTNNLNAFVAFKVRDKSAGYIGHDSRVKIGGFPIELAGGSFLDLTVATPLSKVTVTNVPGAGLAVLSDKYGYEFATNQFKYVPLTKQEKGYYLRLDQSETLLAQAQRILTKLDGITAKIDAALPGITGEITDTLATARGAISGATNDLQASLATLRAALPGLTNELQKVLAGANATTAQLRETIPGLTNDVHLTLLSVRTLLDDPHGAIQTLSTDVKSTLSDAKVTLTNINTLLLRDTNVLANVSNLASNANTTVTTLHGGLRRLWPFSKGVKEREKAERAGRSPGY